MTETAPVHPDNDEQFQIARNQVLVRASQQLRAFLPTFDRPLMHNPKACSLLLRAIQRNRNFRAFILYADPRDALEKRHDLLEVARRLPSYFEMRLLPPEHRKRTDTLLIANREALLTRPDERFLQKGLCHGEPGRIARAAEAFDELWNRSQKDNNTRLLQL